MNSNVILTRHGQKRAKKRLGLNSRAAQRIANRAYEQGLTREQIGGKLKKYLDYETDFHEQMDETINNRSSAYDVRVYNGSVYVFTEEKMLVTVYAVPSKFAQRARQIELKARARKNA